MTPTMHLLELERNWHFYEIIFRNGKRKNLSDLFLRLGREVFDKKGVVFILKKSRRKIILRPQQDGKKWLAQKLQLAGRGDSWQTIGHFEKFSEIKIAKLKEGVRYHTKNNDICQKGD